MGLMMHSVLTVVKQVEDVNSTSYILFMELTYPINFIGYGEGKDNGDVVTRHGEYIGAWRFIEDKENESGSFEFIADGETEPLISESVAFLDSGLLTGMALSNIGRSIREWHDESNQV